MNPDPNTAGWLVYLYGFVSATRLPRSLPSQGVEGGGGGCGGAAVELLVESEIGALMSWVAGESYAEGPLAERLKDTAWVAQRAARHNQVLAEIARESTVIPCRFCTLFGDSDRLREAIRRHRGALLETLARFDNRLEWAIKGYLVLAQQEPEGGGGGGGGAEYLVGLSRQRALERDTAARARVAAQEVLDRLDRLAVQIAALPLRDLRPDPPGELLFNVACLVARSESGRFLALLRALNQSATLALTWTGPLPPYSFVGDLVLEDSPGPGA